jgi:hypothetical protein
MADITFKSIATVIDYAELAATIEHCEAEENREFAIVNRLSEDPVLAKLAIASGHYLTAKLARAKGFLEIAMRAEARADRALAEASELGGFEY